VFIYKFHRLVRHRLVWGVFAIVTAFAFIASFCFRSGGNNRGSDTVATIGDQKITQDDFLQYENTVRGIGYNRNSTSPTSEIVTQIWERIAAEQVAKNLGLKVSPRELRSKIENNPAFMSTHGVFDKNRYKAILQRYVGLQTADAPEIYEDYLGQQMLFQKLAAVVCSASWVTPLELEDELGGWTDQLTLHYATFSNRLNIASLSVTEPQLRAYFEAHADSFYLQNRVAVQYVALPISNFIARVNVPDEDIRAYYDDHSDLFVRTTASNTTESMTLAEARPKIIAALKEESARHIAVTNLYESFLQIANEGSNGFRQAAQTFHLPVAHTSLFAADGVVSGIEADAEKAFRIAAFDLDPSQVEGRYNVVPGKQWVYVIATLTNNPAHAPALEEVIDRVRPLVLAKLRDEQFKEQVSSAHKNMIQSVKTGSSFEVAARAQGLNVSTSITFIASTDVDFDHVVEVRQAALHLQPGETSDATFSTNSAIFVHMDTRVAGDPLSVETLRAQVRNSLARARNTELASAWMKWILDQKDLHLSKKQANLIAPPTTTKD